MAAEPSHSPLAQRGLLSTMDSFELPSETWTILGVLLATVLVHRIWNQHKFKLPPLINPGKLFDLTGAAVKKDFVQRSSELIEEGSKAFGERPYCIMSDTGPVIMLAPKHVDEIRNDPKLSFLKNLEHVSKKYLWHRGDIDQNHIGLPCLPAWFRTIWCKPCIPNPHHSC